jgi:hypothetical protein
MLGNAFFILDKLYYIASFSTGKAMVGISFGVNFAAWFVIIMERAEYLIVFI